MAEVTFTVEMVEKIIKRLQELGYTILNPQQTKEIKKNLNIILELTKPLEIKSFLSFLKRK